MPGFSRIGATAQKIPDFCREFPSGMGIETLTLDNGTPTDYTSYREMALDAPAGAVLVKANLLALLYAMNLGTNGFAVNMSLQFRKGAGTPVNLFAASPGFSVPAVQYSITPWVGSYCVSIAPKNVVDDLAATYSARFTLTGVGTTNNLRCLTGYVLVLYYRMG